MPPPNLTPSSPEDSLQQLQRRVAELSAQLAELERRLARIEAPPPAGNLAPPLPSASQSRVESRFGLTLVNRAGAITLAIGIIFFFKYAVDNQWVGAEGRVAIGVAVGLLLLIAAEWKLRRDRLSPATLAEASVFTQGIAGCALAIIYTAVYAAYAYYELIIPIAGWSFLVLVSGCAVVLSLRYNSAAIAALGFTGGLLTPMLLHNAATAWWFDLFFLLLLGMTSVGMAARQRWSVLVPCLAALALVSAAVSLEPHHAGWFAIFSILLALAHLAVSQRSDDRRFSNYAYLTGHGCLLVAAVRGVALWTDVHSAPEDRYSFTSALESVLLAVYGIAALAYGMLRTAARDRMLGLVLLGLVITKLYLWDVWQLNRFYRISAFVALGILLLTASYVYSRLRGRPSA